jgi:hypothetical protein
MGNLNPFGIIRDNSSNPSLGRQVHVIGYRCTGSGSGGVVTMETKLKSIVAVIVQDESNAAPPAVTVADSSTYTSTKTVAFTAASGHTYSVIIVGIVGTRIAFGTDTITTATTVTYEPLKGI